MFAKKIDDENDGNNRKNYANDALATLGDSVLKCVLAEYFFDKKEDKNILRMRKRKFKIMTRYLLFLSD